MDKYGSMTDLYADQANIEGTTYGKRWRRHEWSQLVEEQVTDNMEIQMIIMAIHGGGIEPGTSEIALAAAGYHPATVLPTTDGQGLHDLWLFEGLQPRSTGNGHLHVTATHYNEPIATELVQNARRCISLHGCSDTKAKVSETDPVGKIQIGGLDFELRQIVLEELTTARIPAEITTDDDLKGEELGNIGNKTQVGGCVQLEMGTRYRASLFETNTRPRRKHTTNAQFWLLVGALRRAMSKADVRIGDSPAITSCGA
ncbi:MAG: hypothetical protein HOO98_03565 [Nitrospira sp.]|nr:hypothetical protein [Nitrospira sp.]TKB91491.1 MAG: hypothetical protein E8D40_08265 [Nitrospira sp.]